MEWHAVLALGIPFMVLTLVYLCYLIIDGIYSLIHKEQGKAATYKGMTIKSGKEHSRL